MTNESKIKDLYSKIELLQADLDFHIKYTAMKAGEHTDAKNRVSTMKEQIKEYKERIRELEKKE